jgi:hypothetical protein
VAVVGGRPHYVCRQGATLGTVSRLPPGSDSRISPACGGGAVLRGEQRLAVKRDGEAVPLRSQRQRVPLVGQIAGGGATTMPMSPEAGKSAVSPPRRGLGPTEKIHPPSIIRSGHHREAATPACGDLSVQHRLIGLPALKFLRRPYGGPVGERKRSSVERLGSFTRQVRARPFGIAVDRRCDTYSWPRLVACTSV